MKRILSVVSVMLFAVSLWAINRTFQPYGFYYQAETPAESVVSVTSMSYSKSLAIERGLKRVIQNTGNYNLNYFFLEASSATTGLSYLAPGEKWIEKDYFGDVYFGCPAGSTTTTLSIWAIQNKQ